MSEEKEPVLIEQVLTDDGSWGEKLLTGLILLCVVLGIVNGVIFIYKAASTYFQVPGKDHGVLFEQWSCEEPDCCSRVDPI